MSVLSINKDKKKQFSDGLKIFETDVGKLHLSVCMHCRLIKQYKKMLELLSELNGWESCQLHNWSLLGRSLSGFFFIRK